MFFRRWFRNTSPAAPVRRPASPKLGLEGLGDRLAPSATGLGGAFGPPPLPFGMAGSMSGPGGMGGPARPPMGGSTGTGSTSAAVATHFAVVVKPESTAGGDVKVDVVALDANNRPVSNYTGTVTLSSSDAAATGLPAEGYTFTAADNGRHTFTVSLNTVGSQTLTATETSTATGSTALTGTGTTTVVAAGAVTHFAVQVRPSQTTPGASDVTVVALDANNKAVPNYTGTVNLSTTDTGATGLPASYTFAAADKGVTTFTVTFSTPTAATSTTATTGTSTATTKPTAPARPTVTATDAADATITGTSSSLPGRPVGPGGGPRGHGGPRLSF